MTDAAVVVARRSYTFVMAAGLGLGGFAFVADLVEGMAGQVMTALTSSGFAWGLAAFLAGRAAPTRRLALVGGTLLLVVATLLYYLLILLVSRRWSGAYLEDGSSADLIGLRSVAITTAAWLVGSLVAGPVLAWLGHTVRISGVAPAAAATGVAVGLLSGEGWSDVYFSPPWRYLASAVGPQHAEWAHERFASQLARVVLPLAVLGWLTVSHRLYRAWHLLVASTLLAGAASAVGWYLVQVARNMI